MYRRPVSRSEVQALPVRQQRPDGGLLDWKVVWYGKAATYEKRVDAVEALPSKLFVSGVARADRWERERCVAEEVIIRPAGSGTG